MNAASAIKPDINVDNATHIFEELNICRICSKIQARTMTIHQIRCNAGSTELFDPRNVAKKSGLNSPANIKDCVIVLDLDILKYESLSQLGLNGLIGEELDAFGILFVHFDARGIQGRIRTSRSSKCNL